MFLPITAIRPKVDQESISLISIDLYAFYTAVQVGKARFHKSHAFDYNRDVPVFVGEEKPGIGEQYPVQAS